MRIYSKLLILISGACLFAGCALNDPEVVADTEDFPFRLVLDEEGADLPDAEDYDAELAFADYIGELPAAEIVLNYTLIGEGDFSNVSIDEIIYEVEEDDCVYIYEVPFTGTTITLPVNERTGTLPEAIEIVFSHNLATDEATDGGYAFELTMLETSANVVLNDVAVFEYEILDNDVAGEWVYEITSEESFDQFREVFGTVAPELNEISFTDITGEVVFEFEFGEVKIEVELEETEVVEECEDGVVESEEENLVIEIEADYDAEDGELELEGSYFTDEGEELDFIIEMEYAREPAELLLDIFTVIDEDNFEEGEELFSGEVNLNLVRG